MKPRVALALSGGGFRASLFHLGVLKRLAEVNLLSKVEVISTVSGGSIVGAFLVLRWQRWLEAGGDAAALENIVAQPFRELLANHNLIASVDRYVLAMAVSENWQSSLLADPSCG